MNPRLKLFNILKLRYFAKSLIWHLFRSRKKISTTYPIVSFFFSRPFNETIKFLKNCPNDFHKILHSHFTPKGAPGYAKASKSYDWDLRNEAKKNPKIRHFWTFFNFREKCPYDFNGTLSSLSTPTPYCYDYLTECYFGFGFYGSWCRCNENIFRLFWLRVVIFDEKQYVWKSFEFFKKTVSVT